LINIWPDRFGLTNKVVVVTGGAGLIGEKICWACGQAGAKVVIADIDEEKARKLEREMHKKKLEAYYVHMDITSENSVKSAIKQLVDREGRIDVWINNAYPRTHDWGNKLEDVKLQSWKKNVDMHLNGYFICIQNVIKIMKQQKSGCIINFGSIYGVVGPTFSIYEGTDMTMPAAYSAIKGGIINFTRYLASYLGKYNIRVNAVCPGGVFDNQDPIFVGRYSKHTPLGRMASAEEIAAPVVFLASEAASYITGHILMVDGGWTAC